MVRLVVHGGTHATGWVEVQRQLIAWREPLAAAGIALHPSDAPEEWTRDALALISGSAPPTLAQLFVATQRDEAAAVVVSTERLEDPLRDPEKVAALARIGDAFGLSVQVVQVLRDQLGYLNELYVDRVCHLQMARDFEAFAADPTPAERFDYASALAALEEAPDVALTAVRHAPDPATLAGSVLVAGGIEATIVASLPATVPERTALPGPIAIGATRLLFKRLWRLGLLNGVPKQRLTARVAALLTHGAQAGWDSGPFWGWHPAAEAAARTGYRASNDAIAQRLWGTPWGDDWSQGEYDDADLASRDPRIVRDVLDTVDRLAQTLQREKAQIPGQ